MIDVTKTPEHTTIKMDNGHRTALEKIVKDYNLKGEKEAIAFIISVISEADGKEISNGKGNFLPSDSLKKTSE